MRHQNLSIAAGRDEAEDNARAIAGFADVKKHIGKIVVLRGLGDGVKAHENLGGDTVGNLTDAWTPRPRSLSLPAGQIGLAVKSDHLNPGNLYDSTGGATPLPEWAASHPVQPIRQIVSPAHERDDVRLSNALIPSG